MWPIGPKTRELSLAMARESKAPFLEPVLRLAFDALLSHEEAMALTVADADPNRGILTVTELRTGMREPVSLDPALLASLVDLASAPEAARFQANAPDGTLWLVPWMHNLELLGNLREALGADLISHIPGEEHSRRYYKTARAARGEQPLTRLCTDPWSYAEISDDGAFRPCCNISKTGQPIPEPGKLHEARDRAAIRRLRQGLLTGALVKRCSDCHIRPMVAPWRLRRQLEREGWKAAKDPLAPLAIRDLRIDVTSRCNLRCTYCAVTSPGYDGKDMAQERLDSLLPVVESMPDDAQVHVSGHGETTFHPGWAPFCKALIDRGRPPHIITNLARNYTDDEIAILARFGAIQVSLDSHDAEMMRKIRKAVRPQHVFDQLNRIRKTAREARIAPPTIAFSIGVYDPSIWTLEAFAKRLINEGAKQCTFWNLVEYPHQKHVRALRRFSAEDAARAGQILHNVRDMLGAAKVGAEFAGDFRDADGDKLI